MRADWAQRIAEGLRTAAHVCGRDVPCPCYDWSDAQYEAAVHATAVSAGHVDEVCGVPESFADALLPVVAEIVAAELEAAAEDIHHDPGFLETTAGDCDRYVALEATYVFLNDRAAGIRGAPGRPGNALSATESDETGTVGVSRSATLKG